MEQDTRWKQRFQNYENAFNRLQEAIAYYNLNPIDIVKEAVIQCFEFTHELSWKVMKDFLEYEGITGIVGSRGAVREAFNKGLITQGQTWMDMIESRNYTVHTYHSDILAVEFTKIVSLYVPLFTEFREKMKTYL
ncbi:nucleotidyltransferase substrate binding protein [Rhodoflexus sp.]